MKKASVTDIADYELDLSGRQSNEIVHRSRIGKLVQNSHMSLGMVPGYPVHEIRANEATAPGHQDIVRALRLH